jgi:hypothetical protein
MDFRNTVTVMTSNLGAEMIQQMAGDDYRDIKVTVMAGVKSHFRAEFVKRIDEIVVFNPLTEKDMASISKTQFASLEARLAKLEIKLAGAGNQGELLPVYGARPLKHAIQQQIRWRWISSPASSLQATRCMCALRSVPLRSPDTGTSGALPCGHGCSQMSSFCVGVVVAVPVAPAAAGAGVRLMIGRYRTRQDMRAR